MVIVILESSETPRRSIFYYDERAILERSLLVVVNHSKRITNSQI